MNISAIARPVARIFSLKKILFALFYLGLIGAFYLWKRESGVDPFSDVGLQQLKDSKGLFLGIYTLSIVAAIPTLPLNLAAGFFWGPWIGGLVTVISTSGGALVAFLASRFFFGQPLAKKFDSKMIKWMQHEFDSKGWRFLAFIRMNPIFPTGPLNYLLGLTSMRKRTYIWATTVFLAPPSFAVAYLGDTIGGLINSGQASQIMRNVTIVAAIITVLIAWRYAAKYFNEARINERKEAREG